MSQDTPIGMDEGRSNAVCIDPENNEVKAERSVRQSGNSTVVSLPPALLSAAGLSDGIELTIAAIDGEIMMSPKKNASG